MAKSLVFIDSRVADYQTLVAGLSTDTEWVLLDANEDGVRQMQGALAGYSGLDSIQVISHGDAGSLQLGSTVLDSSNLDSYANPLKAIGSSLTVSGDILLYGCEVAAGSTGQHFIERLASLTGADIAASDNVTGAKGDWTLEQITGPVEAPALSVSSYGGTLLTSVITGTEGNDTLSGGGTDDTIYGLGGDDVIDGQTAHDYIDGGSGNDTIDGNFGNDTIYGGLGNDTLIDSQGSNYLDGEEGNDRLTASALTGNHTLVGGLGNDTIDGIGASMVLQGGDGVDNLIAHGNLSANNTTTYVQHGAATISGGAGDDGYTEYQSWNGSTVGYYNNALQASYLANVLVQGDDGRDGLYVSYSKNARLEGGAGADHLSAYAYGPALNDIGESYGINYQLDGGADNDTLEVTTWAYRYYGRIDLSLEGGTGNDTLKVSTSNPADAIIGISSAVLSGGDGDDRLESNGVLQLTLTGGLGTDTFVLTAQQYQAQQKGTMQFSTQQATQANGWNYALTDVTARPMEITDFVAGNSGDMLDVRDLLQNGATGYDGTNPFATGHLNLLQSGADTLLQFDANGSADAFVTLAVLKDVDATEVVAKNFYPLFGTPNADFLEGTPGGDKLYGIGGDDTISGGGGDDTIDGGSGNDSMSGGAGDDSYCVDNLGDLVSEAAGEGRDKVIATIDYVMDGNVEDLDLGSGASRGTGNALDNVMQGNDNGNELHGGGGNDHLKGGKGHDKLTGGDGDDRVDAGEGDDEIVGGDGAGNDSYSGGTGIDTVKYTSAITGIIVDLAAGTASGNEIGNDTLSGIENIIGGQAGDNLKGDSLANVINGSTGDDTITGMAGADTLTGGAGNDTFNYSAASDSTAAAMDTIVDLLVGDVIKFNGMIGVTLTSGSYAYATSVAATATAIAANTGITNRAVFFTDASDGYLYVKGAGTGVSFDGTLIKLAGKTTAPTFDQLVGVSVSSGNAINGASGNDSLKGTIGNDVINGYAGNDSLNGYTGADTMVGGDGSDTYYVDNAGDLVTETNAIASTGGADVVQSSLAAYTLSANVENGRIRLTTAANLTGNSLDNILYAGTGNNVLDGGAGIDTVSYAYGVTGTTGVTLDLRLATAQATGGSGSDTLKSIEKLIGSVNNDSLIGSSAANRLEGGAGNDSLNGYTGADTLIGGDGSDTYYVENAGDLVTETNATVSTGGVDVVQSSLAAYTLSDNVENGRIRLTTAANLTGNGLDNILYAGTGDNVLDGGAGIDTVSYAYGISGTTGVTLDLRLATAQATGGSGSDTLKSVEKLIGSANNDSLIGSTAANRLEGGAGNDSLNGYTGADTLIGGDGSDTYYVDNAGDLVTETNATASSGGVDVVQSSLAAYTLTANVENGRIRLTTAANLTGNSLNNILYAGTGANVLDGVSGVDTVSYVYATAAVSVSLATGAPQATGGSGSDTLKNIDKLIGSNFHDTLIGDANANTLDGLALNDALNGGGGNDLLLGGDGSDLLIGGLGKDTLTGGAGNDTFTFNAIGETTASNTTCDVITDFVVGDKIDLSAIDANSVVVLDQPFTSLVVGGAFSGAIATPASLYFDNVAHVLYGNTDGDTAAEFAIQLTGVTTLTTAAFTL